jgi:hypothetical protein
MVRGVVRGTGSSPAGFPLQEIGVPPFVDKSQKPNRVVAHFAVEVKRKRLGPTAGKTMRAGVVTAAPANYFTRLASHPLAQLAGQPFGDVALSGLGIR